MRDIITLLENIDTSITEESRQEMIDAVMDQLKYDISVGDDTSLEMILFAVPQADLESFMDELG